MRLGRLVALVATASMASGCAIVSRTVDEDLHGTGGMVGHYADEFMPASTKEMQLYRMAVAYEIFARLGAYSVANDENAARSLYWQMAAVNDDINKLAGYLDAGPCRDAAPGKPCRELFEADTPAAEGHLLKLALAAVPDGKVKDAWNNAITGSYWSAIVDIAETGEQELIAAHAGAASYRSEQEIFADLIVHTPGAPQPEHPIRNVAEAAKYIDDYGKTQTGANDKFAAVMPTTGSFNALYYNIQEACLKVQDIAIRDHRATPVSMPCDMEFAPKRVIQTFAAAGAQTSVEAATTSANMVVSAATTAAGH